jgi:hypothetical protein
VQVIRVGDVRAGFRATWSSGWPLKKPFQWITFFARETGETIGFCNVDRLVAEQSHLIGVPFTPRAIAPP